MGSIGDSATDIDANVYMADGDVGSTFAGTNTMLVWGAQLEDAAGASSSYIQTTSAVAVRGEEEVVFPYTSPPQAMTLYAKFMEKGAVLPAYKQIAHIGNAGATDGYISLTAANVGSDFYRWRVHDGTTDKTIVAATGPTPGTVVELCGSVSAAGVSLLEQSVDGAATTSSTTSGVSFSDFTEFGAATLSINSNIGNNTGNNGAMAVVAVRGAHSLADMREWLA